MLRTNLSTRPFYNERAVQVVTGKTSRLVAVTTGMYSNNLVQVSGHGIAAGMQVEVASS